VPFFASLYRVSDNIVVAALRGYHKIGKGYAIEKVVDKLVQVPPHGKRPAVCHLRANGSVRLKA
jgi:hypothetical protein